MINVKVSIRVESRTVAEKLSTELIEAGFVVGTLVSYSGGKEFEVVLKSDSKNGVRAKVFLACVARFLDTAKTVN